MPPTAQNSPFGGYDILADAARIAWRAQQRLDWQARRPWWDRLADVLAVACVWSVAAAALLVCVALLLGAGWCVVLLAHALGW